MEFPNISEAQGFYITLIFIVMFMVIAVTAMIVGNDISKDIVSAMTGIVGTIAAYWFATRGQSAQ